VAASLQTRQRPGAVFCSSGMQRSGGFGVFLDFFFAGRAAAPIGESKALFHGPSTRRNPWAQTYWLRGKPARGRRAPFWISRSSALTAAAIPAAGRRPSLPCRGGRAAPAPRALGDILGTQLDAQGHAAHFPVVELEAGAGPSRSSTSRGCRGHQLGEFCARFHHQLFRRRS
jgi:hypothetical protein